MSEKKFSKKHEWVSLDGDTATVGITKHATEMLGDIVFVEVPEPGKSVEKDGQAAAVEAIIRLAIATDFATNRDICVSGVLTTNTAI